MSKTLQEDCTKLNQKSKVPTVGSWRQKTVL